MIAETLEKVARDHIPPEETLVWAEEADTEAVKKAAKTRGCLLQLIYFAILQGVLFSVMAMIYFAFVRRELDFTSLIMAMLFGSVVFLLRRQYLRDQQIETVSGPIIYALTDKSFLIVLGDSGQARKYGPKAFQRIRVRSKDGAEGGMIQFQWQKKDIGGRYTEQLFLKSDPKQAAEALRQQFGAKVRGL